jgi:2,3,4,5-tetrahydropyridine-2-carboxylate N-succinyltransferase
LTAELALAREIDELSATPAPSRERALPAIARLLDALEDGSVRAAEPGPDGWRVHAWVRRGILLAFRVGQDRGFDVEPAFHFRDRDTMATWNVNTAGRKVRVVPGGTTVRRGAFVGEGVVIMPPAYVNVGAWIGPGSMIDSHALVGSCAQIGRRVHLSAAAQIGGVLEPPGALPVIVEDDAFVGGGCGVYEGARVGARAVLAPGVILSRATPLYDSVHGRVLRADASGPLVVPEGAVVVPGSRPARGDFAREHGLALAAPVVVKYRDASTDAAVALEDALR